MLCINRQNVVGLAPCTHEEADTRIMLHLEDVAREKYNTLMIRTVDTDVVILAIATVQHLSLSELWIAFGTGKNFRYLAIHEIARALGPEKCLTLPVFCALIQCQVLGKTAWETWKAYEEITPAFCDLAACPSVEDIEYWLH